MSIFAVASNDAGVYVAVGADETILISVDGGVSWWPPVSQPNIGNSLFGVAFGEIEDPDNPGEFIMSVVAVGKFGTILRTENLSDWVEVESNVTENLNDVEFFGIYIAIGDTGVLVDSPDFGISWQEKDSGSTENLYDITVDDGGGYVIVGDNNTVLIGQLDTADLEREKREKASVMDVVEAEVRYDNVVVADVTGYGVGAGRQTAQTIMATVGGTVETGDTFTVTLTLPNAAPVDYTYTVLVTDTTTDMIATGLAGVITAAGAFSAIAVGSDVFIISDDVSDIYGYASSTTNGGATNDQTLTLTKTNEAALQQVKFHVTAAVVVGNTYSITVGSDTFNYVAIGGDTQDSVALALKNLIDASGNWVAVLSTADTPDSIVVWPESGYAPFTYSQSANMTATPYLTGTEGTGFQIFEQNVEVVDTFSPDMSAEARLNQIVVNTISNFETFSNLLHASAVVTNTMTLLTTTAMRYEYLAEVLDTGYFGDVLSAADVAVITELVSALGSGSNNMIYDRVWTDTLTVEGLVVAALSIIVAEDVNVIDSTEKGLVLGETVVDILWSTGVADSLMTAIMAVAEAMVIEGIVKSGFDMPLTELFDSTTAVNEEVAKYAIALETAIMSEPVVSGALRFDVPVTSSVSVYETLAPAVAIQEAIADGVMFAVTFGLNDVTYNGWVMNTKNFMVSEFQDYPFDSMTWVGGKPVGINDSGLYVLEGTSDAGAPIAAKVLTGLSNFGTSNLKNVEQIFLGFRGNGDILLKTVTKEEIVRWYRLRCDGTGMHERRVKCGRGVKSTYWAVELENVDGSDFDIDSIEVYPVVMSRKMGG